MFAFLYYTLFGLNTFFTFRGKIVKVLLIFTAIVVGILFASNLGEFGDHSVYSWLFYNEEDSDDFFFNKLMSAVRCLGIIRYEYFLLCLYILCAVLFKCGSDVISKNLHPFFFISMFYILPMLGVAIRFTLGLSVLMFSLRYLEQRSVLKYIICCCIATMCHLSLFVSFFFAINFKFNNDIKQISKIIDLPYFKFVIFCVVSAAFIYLSKSFFLSQVGELFSIVAERQGGSNLDGQTTNNGGLLLCPCYFTSLMLSIHLYMSANKRDLTKEGAMVDLCYKINALSSFALPLVFVNLVFIRLLIFPTIVTCLMAGELLFKYPFLRTFKLKFLLSLIFIAWLIPAIFEIFLLNSERWIQLTNEFWEIERN